MVHHKYVMHHRPLSSFILAIGVSLDDTFLSFPFFLTPTAILTFYLSLLVPFTLSTSLPHPHCHYSCHPFLCHSSTALTSSFASSLCLRLSLSPVSLFFNFWLLRFQVARAVFGPSKFTAFLGKLLVYDFVILMYRGILG